MNRSVLSCLGGIHYAWIVFAVTFITLLAASGIRSTPGVLMVPLEGEFGWSRATISLAVSINLVLFGFVGPFAAAMMDRWGIRPVVAGALLLIAAGVIRTVTGGYELAFIGSGLLCLLAAGLCLLMRRAGETESTTPLLRPVVGT